MARIVHVCPRYWPAHGGVELFFAKISEALARRGDSVSVWTTDAATVQDFTSPTTARLSPGPELVHDVEVRRFAVRHVPAQRYLRTAAHCLPFGTRWKCDTLRWTPWVPSLTRAATRHAGQVDLVHVGGMPYSSVLFAGVRLAERTGARLVISPFTHVPAPGLAGARMQRAYLSPLNVRLLLRADRVFAQTELERQMLAGAGVPASRQAIVGLGVDPQETSGGSRDRARRVWRADDHAIVVGHLANKSWDKGTVDLLDAAEQLWENGASFALVLAGPEMPGFTRRWAHARFPERVVNLGELTDGERRDFFAAIDVFALPSYVESFGLAPLEAALNGAAVVAYDHGGPGQIFRHQETALLAPAGNIEMLARSIELLTTSASDRLRLGQAACRVARGYSWKRALDVVLDEYDALLQRQTSSHR
jgi:glycosyltransferase involved in cell wall biosynthesis